jgi:VWFA-related protein
MTPRSGNLARRHSSLALLLGVLAVVAHVPGHHAQAQQQPPSQPQRPTFRAEANLVRVDVYATAGDVPVLDLRQDELQVFEDGAPQKIETFEHVVRRTGGALEERIDPGTVRESNEMAADPRHGVFVLFLDGAHVTFGGANIIASPLVRFIDNILGPDDLIGLMRTEMAATEIAFTRKTTIISRGLTQDTLWGRRNRIGDLDPVEESYVTCYPPQRGESGAFSAVAREMILRRREKMTLDAIRDTVVHLDAIRQERKAIVIVTEGWVLYGRSAMLADMKPVPPQIYVGPRGTFTRSDERNVGGVDLTACDRDRLLLADLENGRDYQELLRVSAESNVSFYPVDPRGLAAFDTALGGLERPLNAIADSAQLRGRLETLHNLATATDGIAVVDSNDLDRGLKRVSDDLSSYYLLGYYTTNTKLDGKYRRISVKVTRPSVTIRARRGYRAASAADVARAARAEPSVPEGPAGIEAAVSREIANLTRSVTGALLNLRAVVEPGVRGATLWVAGELGEGAARSPAWPGLQRDGAEVRVMASAAGGRGGTLGAARVQLAPGARSFLSQMPLASSGEARELLVQAQVTSAAGGEGRLSGAASAAIPGAGVEIVLLSPLLYRGGPGAAAAFRPAAHPQFRRAEILRVEALLGEGASGASARLLDRTGKPLALSIAITERRDDESGRRWLVADVALAPLAAGDFVLALSAERSAAREEILTAFRVLR